MVTDLNLRNIDPARDLAALQRLISDIEQHDLHPALGERKHLYLLDPRGGSGGSAPGLVAVDGSEIFAYVALVEEQGGWWTVETVVHPGRRTVTVLDTLLEKAAWTVLARGGEGIRLWVYVPEAVEAAERAGFRLERELYHMRTPLPLAAPHRLPPGIEVAGFREGVDERTWLEANNRAFHGHPENGNWGLEDLDRRRRLPWFSSEGLRMAWDGETLAGFCWTKTPSPRAGEIYVIGVLPEYQGMGLGRALLVEGAGHMYTRRRARSCVLYVDAVNLPALNMYRSMGFTHHHTDRSYLRRPEGKAAHVRSGTLSAESRNEA